MIRNITAVLTLLVSTVILADDGQDTSLKVRIALIGDSTVASYAKPPTERPTLTGWGQVLDQYFDDHVVVLNHALSGRSSKSFLAEGKWEPVLKEKPDYVFIQFGHNDQPGKGDRSTDPKGDYRDNLRRYIRESRKAGAKPILVTPVARRVFENGNPVTTLTPYVEAMQAVAEETSTPIIDLHAVSLALFEKLGDAGSAHFSPATSDRTHFSRDGALAIAGLVAKEIPKVLPELGMLLKK